MAHKNFFKLFQTIIPMIHFRFKSEEGEDIVVDAPSRWADVTVDHFINPYFLSRDSVSLLSALSGIDRKVLLNSTADITGKLMEMVQFVIDKPQGFAEHEMKPITIMGKQVVIPKDIELERVGQKIMFQDVLGKHKFVYAGLPEAVAIYLIPSLTEDGSFDDELIEEVAAEIRKLPIVDVHPIASFFLTSLKTLATSGSLY